MLLYGPGSWQQATVVMQGDRYLVPRADGRLIVGSSVEDAGFNKSTDSQTQASLRNFAESLLPGLSDRQPERSWAGLRPASRDEIPVIGPHATIKGLFINTGHYRSGIVMAPAAARLLTDQLLGNKPILPVGAYQA
jgi:glycine oxidase